MACTSCKNKNLPKSKPRKGTSTNLLSKIFVKGANAKKTPLVSIKKGPVSVKNSIFGVR